MRNLESKLQQACVKWFDMQYRKYRLNLFSVPNEGARTPANGARMKAQGRRSGVADMFLAVTEPYNPPNKMGAMGLFIEFKYGKGKLTESQQSFRTAVEREAYRYEVVTDFDQFKNLIENYLT